MEQTLFSRQQLAQRWGYDSTKPIETIEAKGALTRVPNIDGVRYHIREIESMEIAGLDINPLSSLERVRKEKEIERLKAEVEKLTDKLTNVKTALAM